ncbi:MAG: saccharopine dehydrogenase NADP-binding domain-containing protein [Candidatus Bathyarchaeota archaeon]|nr:MAG: saccharopine dehydrogenase NADP-binding domain-containing protein [Candidatus Bathyarchaeota archaeon]
MKICVIGAGAQGSVIARILAEDPEIDIVVLANINTQLLQRAAKKIDSSKLTTERVDAGNPDDLARVLKGADVTVNATLPNYNLTIFHSALKSGANYIDFAEDWPLREKFLEQLETSDKWKKAGLTAVKHQGITPGVTNVLARYAADQLDKVEEIHIRTAWRGSSEEEKMVPTWSPGWSVETALLEWTAEPIVYENGEYKRYPPFSGFETHTFPEPMGPATVCWLEHEEIVTLPHFIGKGLKYADIKMSPDIIAGILINIGLAGTESIEVEGAKVKPLDVLLKLAKPAIEEVEERKKAFEDQAAELHSCLAVQVKGEKAGQKVEEYAYPKISESDVREWLRRYGTTNGWVPIPAATTAKMLAKGEIQIKGVIAPECLEPEPFLRKLSEMGMGTFQRIIRKQVVG